MEMYEYWDRFAGHPKVECYKGERISGPNCYCLTYWQVNSWNLSELGSCDQASIFFKGGIVVFWFRKGTSSWFLKLSPPPTKPCANWHIEDYSSNLNWRQNYACLNIHEYYIHCLFTFFLDYQILEVYVAPVKFLELEKWQYRQQLLLRYRIFFSSMALKPIYIRRVRIGSRPNWKITVESNYKLFSTNNKTKIIK